MWSCKKTIKQNQIKPGLLFAKLIVNPLEKKRLDSWVNLNLISVETDVVVIVWTLADMPEQGKRT